MPVEEREEGLLFFFQHLAYLCVAAPPSVCRRDVHEHAHRVHPFTDKKCRTQTVGGIGE